VALVLATMLAGLLHYLAARHYRRSDWSHIGFYRLSPKTLALLDALTDEVEVTVLLKSGHPDGEDIRTLLREYQMRTPRLRVAWVDPDRSPARVEALQKRFPITEPNVVIFAIGDRARVIAEREWIELEPSSPEATRQAPPRRRSFNGEAAFTAALQALTSGKAPIVYYLEGFGERSPESPDPLSSLARLDRLIRQDNIETRRLPLDEQHRIPEDADAILIAGPRRHMPQPILDAIQQYLENSGRAVILLDHSARTGLEGLLQRWGVRVGDEMVVDPARTLTGQEILLSVYPPHEITAPLARYGLCVFYRPRPVEAIERLTDADRPQVAPLALTTDKGWAESHPEARPIRFDPAEDRRGPIAFAAAVERGAAGGLDVGWRPTRLVIFGDAEFVCDRSLSGANGDFFINALRWVLERREPTGLSPKPIAQVRLQLNRSQLRMLAAWIIGVWPALFAVLGLGVRWSRRR